MLELFNQARKITNNNIILAVPLILGIKVLDLYTFFSKVHMDSSSKVFLAFITVLFMSSLFLAAWFYMIKGAVSLCKKEFVMDSDRANASLLLLKTIPDGVGKYFLSFVGLYFIIFFIQIISTYVVYYIGVKLIGSLDSASTQQLIQIASDSSVSSNTGVANFVEQLTPEQIIFFGKWSLLFMVATLVIMYILMLWIPEIIYRSKNPLIALFASIEKVFKDFKKTSLIFLILWIMGFILLFIYTFAIINPIAYMIISVVMYYFMMYVAILIFLYYDKRYVDDHEK